MNWRKKNVISSDFASNESGSQLTKELGDITGTWGSYPKIYNLGHRALTNLFDEDVLVEEKVDGSQFSFCKYFNKETNEYELRCRSKSVQLNIYAPDAMFKKGVETALNLFPILREGWTYRCEYLQKPKHNVLAYERTPDGNIILFDVTTGPETYLDHTAKAEEAKRLGIEVVPVLFHGKITDVQMFRDLLQTVSVLGGQKIEGVVVKNYSRFGIDGRVLLGKFVSEEFKEVHAGDWKERNPKSGDIIQELILKYKTPARWAKAVQHLREAGVLEDSPRDIGKLMPEVVKDIENECTDEIKSLLFKWAWANVRRGLTNGLPEWYKEELLKKQFGG